MPIHASTQMTVHNLEGVLELEKLGFKRVVLSRELSIEEIEYICQNSNVEIEVFIHGALCISYSGQCLFSSMIGGRSGNRGKCAQACRLPYELISNNTPLEKGYLLSTRDLCGLEYLPRLIKAGVKCFKIEGRMKNPEYVATVTRIYRKYMDLVFNNCEYTVSEKDKLDLLQVFNRGEFSTGHLTKNSNLVFPKKPNNMGLLLGTVLSYNSSKGYIKFRLENNISIGDSLHVEKESNSYNLSEIFIKNTNLKVANIGQIVEIGRLKGNISVGDKIYKIMDKTLLEEAKKTYSDNSEFKKIQINANICIKKDVPIELEIYTNSNSGFYSDINFSLTSDIIPVEAINTPITAERISQQLSKTGGTQFELDKINVTLDDNLYIPNISGLNELRRTALEKLQDIVISKYSNNNINSFNFSMSKNCSAISNNKNISILLNTLNTNIDYTSIENANNIYIPLKYFFSNEYETIIKNICNKFKTYIYIPTILRNNYLKLINAKLDNIITKFKPSGFVISNISQIEMVSKYNLELIGNYTLNIFNKYCLFEYKNLNFNRLTPSPELNKQDLLELSNFTNFEYIVYGNLPLMTMNYCLIGKSNNCNPNCNKSCIHDKYYLKDRLGYIFETAQDNIETITTLYNSKTTFINSSNLNCNNFRIDILHEDIDEINSIISAVQSGNRLEGLHYTNGLFDRMC